MIYIGELVRVEYLQISEIDVLCWLCDYSMLGYLDNTDMSLKLIDKEKKSWLYVKSIEPGTNRIDLTKILS